MRRESWRRVTVVVVALVAAACTNAEADSGSTTTEIPTTTATAITTTTNATTPTTTSKQTTTTTATTSPGEVSGTVGSPEALSVLIDEGVAFSALAYGADIDRSIVPDLTALDVVMATRAIFEFEASISTLAPAARWVEVFSLPGSPAHTEYLRSFTTLEENGLRAEISGDGYVVESVRIASEAEQSGAAREVLRDAPEGSLVVSITTSSGPIRFVNEDGNVASSNGGWKNQSRLVIVAPSDSGWKLYWADSV